MLMLVIENTHVVDVKDFVIEQLLMFFRLPLHTFTPLYIMSIFSPLCYLCGYVLLLGVQMSR